MSQLTIENLHFIEDESLASETVQGKGLTYSAKYASTYDTNHWSRYTADYRKSGYKYSYYIDYEVGSAVAGAIASSIAVGDETYTFVGVIAST